MTLTLQDLIDTDPGAFSRSAQAWEAMAEGLDDATEDLIRGSRDLEHVWPDGPAAQAAAQKTHDTRNGRPTRSCPAGGSPGRCCIAV